MVLHCWLSGGRPTLFMDFRKVYEPWEIGRTPTRLGLDLAPYRDEPWLRKGFIDGNNSGSPSLDYAGKAFLFQGRRALFPGRRLLRGFCLARRDPGMAGRLAYSDLSRDVHHGPGRGREPDLPAPLLRKRLPRLGLHLAAHFPDLRPRSGGFGQDRVCRPTISTWSRTCRAGAGSTSPIMPRPQLPLGKRARVRRRPGPAHPDALPDERGGDRGQDAPRLPALPHRPNERSEIPSRATRTVDYRCLF